MGFMDTVDNLTGKVLDAKNAKIIRPAYDLQQQNIEQLERRMRNVQSELDDKTAQLEEAHARIAAQAARIEKLETQMAIDELDDEAVAILQAIANNGDVKMHAEKLLTTVGLQPVRFHHWLTKLSQEKYV